MSAHILFASISPPNPCRFIAHPQHQCHRPYRHLERRHLKPRGSTQKNLQQSSSKATSSSSLHTSAVWKHLSASVLLWERFYQSACTWRVLTRSVAKHIQSLEDGSGNFERHGNRHTKSFSVYTSLQGNALHCCFRGQTPGSSFHLQLNL